MLKNFKELNVWEKAYKLCLEIYKTTKNFPNEEKYGLSSQMRRAAISVPSNIAEGYGRKTIPRIMSGVYILHTGLPASLKRKLCFQEISII